jgi:hypothetical protein
MTINQLEAALITAGEKREARKQYLAINPENGGGYNPYDAEVDKLRAEIRKITVAKYAGEITEKLASRATL